MPGWNSSAALRHERLVWLAARPELDRLHRKWWHSLSRLGRARANARHRGWGHNEVNEDLSDSRQLASLAVDTLAERFTIEERAVIRRTGLLPNWFWPAYLVEFDREKKAAGRRAG